MPHGGQLTIETANVELDADYARSHPGTIPGSHIMLAVTDTGTGMDEETQQRIFEPFFTTKGMGKGTGLGLATVFGIAKEAGGSVWVYSEVGVGTTFKIYLPRVDEIAPTPEQAAPSRSLKEGEGTILLVEDEAGVRALVVATLNHCGYQILESKNGAEAFAHCAEHPGHIDLLLTDLMLPGETGREIAERVMAERSEIKVLYMSGYTDDTVIRHGLLEGNIEFMQKPFSPAALSRKVAAMLQEVPVAEPA